MGIFSMVVWIVAIACGTSVIIEYLKNRRQATKQSSPSAELLQRLETLDARMAVLEQIVTDEGYQLNQEIRRLERRA